MRPNRSKVSTIVLRSRLETTAQGIRAVYTASNQSFNPLTGFDSWKEKGKSINLDDTANALTNLKAIKHKS